jgi:hypothetical protein
LTKPPNKLRRSAMGGFDLQGLPLTPLLDHLRRITPSFTYGRITSSMFRRHLEVRWVDRQLVHNKFASAHLSDHDLPPRRMEPLRQRAVTLVPMRQSMSEKCNG